MGHRRHPETSCRPSSRPLAQAALALVRTAALAAAAAPTAAAAEAAPAAAVQAAAVEAAEAVVAGVAVAVVAVVAVVAAVPVQGVHAVLPVGLTRLDPAADWAVAADYHPTSADAATLLPLLPAVAAASLEAAVA